MSNAIERAVHCRIYNDVFAMHDMLRNDLVYDIYRLPNNTRHDYWWYETNSERIAYWRSNCTRINTVDVTKPGLTEVMMGLATQSEV
jgi:hypothetical protein